MHLKIAILKYKVKPELNEKTILEQAKYVKLGKNKPKHQANLLSKVWKIV